MNVSVSFARLMDGLKKMLGRLLGLPVRQPAKVPVRRQPPPKKGRGRWR